MALYQYTALDARGSRTQGVLAGTSEQAVLAELEQRRLVPVSIRQSDDSGIRVAVSARALGESYGQLADLLHAGVPMLRAIRLLGNRRSSPKIAILYRELAEKVEKGSDLAAAMSDRPEVFPPVHVAMVRAGERGGFLEQVLSRLSELLAKQASLRSKVVGALIYPAILSLFGSVAVLTIFIFMVPKYRHLFDKMKGGVPTITKVVFGISDAVTTHGVQTAVVLALLVAGLWWMLRRPGMNERVEAWKARLPVVGPIIRGYACARFCQLLGAMLGNGVPMLGALQIARDGTGNILLARAIDRAADEVRSGRALATPLSESGLFDDGVIEMIHVGETANNLDQVLAKAANSLEARLDQLLSTAIRLIEPLMLLIIAGIIGMVAMAFLLPMSRIGSAI